MKRIVLISVLFSFVFLSHAQIWKVPEGHETRWTSFENPTGAKGTAAQANKGAKGSAFGRIMAGDSCVLLSQQGPGIINRIWLTVSKRNPKMLRALRIKFYWDNSVVPAVDVPLGDFFGNPLSRTSRFENCFFSNPEKRSFNCCIPMPYRTGAKVVFVNTSDEDLTHLFYDINFTKLPEWDSEMSYFHAVWREDKSTKLGVDYTVLPQLSGRGRFLGVSLGIFANKAYETTWWGEGEIKFYIDGDEEYPTICGTGTEDYFGGSWSFAKQVDGKTVEQNYCTPYLGYPYYSSHDELIHNFYHNDDVMPMRGFYRWHIQDPICFDEDLKVTIQQIGVGYRGLFERQDDVASVAYWYQAEPHNSFPELPGKEDRWPR